MIVQARIHEPLKNPKLGGPKLVVGEPKSQVHSQRKQNIYDIFSADFKDCENSPFKSE